MAEAPDIFAKQYILTAGPTPLPPRVSQVMAEPILYHRAPAFVEIYARVLERLPLVFQTRQRGALLRGHGNRPRWSRRSPTSSSRASPPWSPPAASSASAGPRSATPTAPTPLHLEFEWGEKVDPARLDEALAGLGRPARAVFTTQSETSTGVVNDIRALNEVATAHGSVLCVDAVSGLGAVDLPQDEWGVDVVVAGSQKSLMCPPGLAFASVSERAMALAAENPGRRYYLDWGRTAAGQKEEPPNSAFTPGGDPVSRARRGARPAVRGGPRAGLRPPRAARPRRAGRGRGAGAGAVRPRRRERERGHRGRGCRRRSTAPRCRS